MLNLVTMFTMWTMWSIMAAMIQTAHDKDPSVFHFKDFVDYEDYLNPTPEEMKAYRQAVSSLSVMPTPATRETRVPLKAGESLYGNWILVRQCITHSTV